MLVTSLAEDDRNYTFLLQPLACARGRSLIILQPQAKVNTRSRLVF